MSNSTKDKKNLKKYAALAGAFITGGAVNAQIQYVDINPDVVLNLGDSLLLDMDGNSVTDLAFRVGSFSGSGTAYGGLVNFQYSGFGGSVSAPNGGGIMGSVSSQASMNIASMLMSSNLVDSGGNFLSDGILASKVTAVVTGLYSTTITQYPGYFAGQTDKYIGVRFDIGGNNHYGWVRLDAAGTYDQITIKDYAYNAVPDLPLYAGQTVGLDDVSIDQKVTVKTMPEEAMINVTPDLIGGEISVVDMQGREVQKISIADLNTTVSYNNMNSGIYMINVNANAEQISHKVYVH